MKPARKLAAVPAPRTYSDGKVTVTVERVQADPARRARLVRALAVLLDKPDTPDESGKP